MICIYLWKFSTF